jgi:uncharacterized membrane protein
MTQSNKPRSEPEIIPPDHAGQDTHRTRTFGTERIYVATPGPVGLILVVLITGVLMAVLLALLLATLVIWLPLLVFFIAGVIIGRGITILIFSRW